MSDVSAPLSPPVPADTPARGHDHVHGLQPGHVIASWRWVLGVGWSMIVVALCVTAGAADVLHRSVWWIGDSADPAPVYFYVLPFLAPITVISCSLRNTRWLCELSAVATLTTFLVALGDRNGSPSAALVTAGVAVAGLLLTVASFSGRVRSA